jgi:hypothetical protein
MWHRRFGASVRDTMAKIDSSAPNFPSYCFSSQFPNPLHRIPSKTRREQVAAATTSDLLDAEAARERRPLWCENGRGRRQQTCGRSGVGEDAEGDAAAAALQKGPVECGLHSRAARHNNNSRNQPSSIPIIHSPSCLHRRSDLHWLQGSADSG